MPLGAWKNYSSVLWRYKAVGFTHTRKPWFSQPCSTTSCQLLALETSLESLKLSLSTMFVFEPLLFNERWRLRWKYVKLTVRLVLCCLIAHFWAPLCLRLKAKMTLICMKLKVHVELASYADVLRLVTHSSPRKSAQRTGHIRSLAVSQS